MYSPEYYAQRKEELTKDFQELRNKFANKILALHDEQTTDERKLQEKFQQIINQEEQSKKELVPEVKDIEDKQEKKK